MDDDAAVRERLGRAPRGAYTVVVRDEDGGPVVIRNAPLLDDGTPMPTRYWLLGPDEVRAVARLEAAGGVREAEAALDPAAVAAAHGRYAAERDAELQALGAPAGAPRPTGGVGGARAGVKCLHAHYAWFLAGGDDPVGRWISEQLAARLDVEIAASVTSVVYAGHDHRLPVGPATLLSGELRGHDPPTPEQLTNALGTVTDHVDDLVLERPGVLDATDVRVHGAEAWHLLAVERGHDVAEPHAMLSRDEAEDVFRTVATERRADRMHNPALQPERVDTIVGTACVLVAVMRRLRLPGVLVNAPEVPRSPRTSRASQVGEGGPTGRPSGEASAREAGRERP